MAVLSSLDASEARDLGSTPAEFVQALPGPSIIRFAGRDASRCRVASVLLHGSERSGLVALHRLLIDEVVPAVDLDVFVGAVEAAATQPLFTRRMLPDRLDLNRCFVSPPEGLDGEIARAAVQALSARTPEFAVDLHNNSGDNPSYGVLTSVSVQTKALVGLFTNRCVATDLRLGTFMEVMNPVCPTATIECGRGGTVAADQVSYTGLREFATFDIIEPSIGGSLEMYHCERRVQVRAGVSVDIAEQPTGQAHLTLRADLEAFNFRSLPADEPIGWVGNGSVPLVVTDLGGAHVGEELFYVDEGVLRTRTEIFPAMMTSDSAVVAADCLCYLIERQ